MFNKPLFVIGLFVFFLVASNLGADRLFFVVAVLLPLVIETCNAAINKALSQDGFVSDLWFGFRRLSLIISGKKDVSQIDAAGEKQIRLKLSVLFQIFSIFVLTYVFWVSYNFLFGYWIESQLSNYQAGIYLGFFILLALLIRYEKRSCLYASEESRYSDCQKQMSAAWLRFFGFVLMLNIILIAAYQLIALIEDSQQTLYFYWLYDQAVFVLWIFYQLVLCETLFRIVFNLKKLFSGEKFKDSDLHYLIRAFFSESSFRRSLDSFFADLLGIDLKKSEIIKFFISIFEPVLIFSLLLVWLLTSVVIVDPANVGIFYRLGEIVSGESAEPGFYLKLPWPFGWFELQRKNLVRVVNVGFTPAKDARHFIWTKPHSTENFNLLTGEGLELVSIDCQVMYRISNTRKFVNNFQNPEELISVLAYRFLTLETVSSSFDRIMGVDRATLAKKLEEDIQRELDKRDGGIKIVKVALLAMHPPIEVANAYENVISAQIDRKTFEQVARTESVHNVFMHQAFAKGEVLFATGQSALKVAESAGNSQAFISKSLGYNFAPELARFRLRLESLEKISTNQKLYIIDNSFFRAKDRLLLRISE
jgi:regulator of protease activity HflC (stomatin/prohibitin superfamily)